MADHIHQGTVAVVVVASLFTLVTVTMFRLRKRHTLKFNFSSPSDLESQPPPDSSSTPNPHQPLTAFSVHLSPRSYGSFDADISSFSSFDDRPFLSRSPRSWTDAARTAGRRPFWLDNDCDEEGMDESSNALADIARSTSSQTLSYDLP
jgi:hypothetical protein